MHSAQVAHKSEYEGDTKYDTLQGQHGFRETQTTEVFFVLRLSLNPQDPHEFRCLTCTSDL